MHDTRYNHFLDMLTGCGAGQYELSDQPGSSFYAISPGLSATLTLPDYGRVARHPGAIAITSYKPTDRY
jgi:hypothetical protein